MTCPDEQELIEAYLQIVEAGGSAKIVRLALMIHRKHCPLCRTDYLRTNYRMGKPQAMMYPKNRKSRKQEAVTV